MISIPVDILITEKYYVKLLISIEFSDRFSNLPWTMDLGFKCFQYTLFFFKKKFILGFKFSVHPLFHLKKNSYPVSKRTSIWLFSVQRSNVVFLRHLILMVFYTNAGSLICFHASWFSIVRSLENYTMLQ